MKPLLFASRLAFICNLLFLLCILIQRTTNFIGDKEVTAMVILLGWMVAPFQNLLVNCWYGILLLNKSDKRLPIWLWLVNLTFLFIQFIIYFILPL